MSGSGGGNRQDNRQRGNAAQLLEKYKSMARDAQLGGDRVQTEYYLQFADHYFRVLGESQSRFEGQRRGRDDGVDGDSDEDEGIEMAEADNDAEAEADERPQRREARGRDRDERTERPQRRDRPERGNGRVRDEQGEDEGGERIPFDVLPPAIGADEREAVTGQDAEEEAAPPRRRTRRPRPDDSDTEIAPAA